MIANAQQSGPRPSDKWIPLYLVLFFVVMLTPLAPMAYYAVHTLPGVVTDDSYEKGLAYNKYIEAQKQQEMLGWKAEVSLVAVPGPLRGRVNYMLSDAKGQPISDASVHVWLVRPSQDGLDHDGDMKPIGNGQYEALLRLPEHGLWDVRVSATRDGKNFQTDKRIVVP